MDTWKLTEGPSGAKRDIRFEIFVRSIVGGASSGIIQPRRKTVDVCVDEFNAFLHPSSRNAAQRIQDGARRTIESLDPALKRVIMKVKWEVHSLPFRDFSHYTKEFWNEW